MGNWAGMIVFVRFIDGKRVICLENMFVGFIINCSIRKIK